MVVAFNSMLDRLEKTYEREKQFSSDASHKLRTPISVILAESQYGKTFSEADSQKSFAKIEDQAQKMKGLVNQLLDLSRLDQDDRQDFEQVDFSHLVTNSLANLTLILDGKIMKEEVTPGLYVYGDESLLSRLFDNLLSNAVKFSKQVIIVKLFQEESQIVLEIIDDGPGIAKDQQEKISQRFYQVDDSRNKKANQGNGLGLSFVKRIADLHGTQLEIESDFGHGSLFRMVFRAYQTDPPS